MQSCLIVDDSSTIRKVSKMILEKEGFTCGEAENGQVALEICRKNLPDFILLDWNMPVMSGIEFLRALRALPGGDKPTVVLCTTENDLNHIQEAMLGGANEYIMKPFDAEIMHGKLAQLGLVTL